jgi:extracellular factor (EF) 3-hydroxypalmitic acid methyl ester biosynthesis protein
MVMHMRLADANGGEGYDLLDVFQDESANSLVALAQPRTIQAGEILIQEGAPPPGLFIVTRGLFDVLAGSEQPVSVGKRGPGELLGEVSFITGKPANASVVAMESSDVFAIDADRLQEHLEKDVVFAAQLYRELARGIAAKLTEQTRRTTPMGQALTHSPQLDEKIRGGLHAIRSEILQLEADLARSKGTPEEKARLFGVLDDAMNLLNSLFADSSGIPPALHPTVASYLRGELLPFVLLSRVCERSYTKPRGYAGDFQVIDIIYAQEPAGSGRLGPMLDEYFLNIAVSKAVRNRRGLLVDEFRKLLSKPSEDKVHITSLACGPAREVFDLFQWIDDPNRVLVHCLDLDFQALSAVNRRAEEGKIDKHIRLLQENLIFLATGRRKSSLPPQDLMYSIGLIDYFPDKLVTQLINWIFDTLKPGGKVILGNFDPRCPNRVFMDYLLEWRLTYRSEEDMRRLFAASKFGDRPVEIRFEQENINLFASCRK